MVRERPARRAPIDPAKLTKWRDRRNLNQSELARLAGTSPSHISSIESGRSGVSHDMLGRLAAALGVHYTALMRRSR